MFLCMYVCIGNSLNALVETYIVTLVRKCKNIKRHLEFLLRFSGVKIFVFC